MKRNFILLFICFSLTALFSEQYFVCIGSFSSEKYLDEYIKNLSVAKIDVNIQKVTVKGQKYTRVLLKDSFEKIEDAKKASLEFSSNPTIVNQKITGLWVVKDIKVQKYSKSKSTKKADVDKKTEIKNEVKTDTTSDEKKILIIE